MDIFISILSTLATFGEKLLGLKKNSKNHKLRQFYKASIIVVVVIAIFLGVYTICSVRINKEKEYQNLLNEALVEISCENYDSASKLCTQAEDLAFDKMDKFFAKYLKGVVYSAKGVFLDDDDYLHSALKEYHDIIIQCDDHDVPLYTYAVADSCYIYRLLNYSYTDENWTELITWLEEKYDSGSLEGLGNLDATLAYKVATVLAHYYTRAAEKTTDTDEEVYYYDKAALAWNSTMLLLAAENFDSGINPFDDVTILESVEQFCSNALQYNTKYYNKTGEFSEAEIEKIITLCESALTNSASKQLDAHYIKLHTIIGRCHWFLAYSADNADTQDEHTKKQYEITMPLVKFQLDSDYTDPLVFDAGLYAMASRHCTYDDIIDILALYEKGLNRYSPKTHLSSRIDLLTIACGFCDSYLRMYREIPEIREFATEVIEELESMWSRHLTDSDRQTINNLKSLLD